MRLLIVEDEPEMEMLLRTGLREFGHTVLSASDGREGLELASNHTFDAIILDLLLPNMSGYEVIAQLRSRNSSVPILMLTACNGESDIVACLDVGADDYLTKPFSFAEMAARLQTIARAAQSADPNRFTAGPLTVERDRHRAFRDGSTLDLTPTEFRLLICLMASSGRAVSRYELIRAVWGSDRSVNAGTIDTFINLLRNKVDVPFSERLIHTVKGVGYCVRAPENGRVM